ncbi:endolytic transglycosylase MltG [Microbacterium sp. A93]|uniref:endolytic transglycosylase MltG n=1 Tax=Microbacterium sp. A93 TaxID=3450716 RepID=UPI003F41CA03
MPTSGAESASLATERGQAKPAPSTLDDLFQPEHDESHRAPRKKKRRTGCLVALIIILVLIGGAVYGGFWAMSNYGDKINEVMGWGEPTDWEPGLATGEVTVTIREGDTGGPVSTALFEAGVTKTEDVFYDYLVDENVDFTVYPGLYTLQEKMTAAAALEALNDPANKLENTVATVEGGTIESSLPLISEAIGIPIEDLQAAVKDPSAYGVTAATLEGWLFPATYTFDPEVTATQVIQRMVDRTRQSLAEAGVPAGDENRVLTIASIIEREGRTGDFAKVSRVIQNRLDDGMMLQMDSTAQYGYGELHAGVVSTSEEAQFDENAYNTYVIEGLPIGPIANPSHAAIDAAMHPVDGPWFYFVTINPQSGETVFSTTYAEHQAGIEVWHEWCRANPDQGC